MRETAGDHGARRLSAPSRASTRSGRRDLVAELSGFALVSSQHPSLPGKAPLLDHDDLASFRNAERGNYPSAAEPKEPPRVVLGDRARPDRHKPYEKGGKNE